MASTIAVKENEPQLRLHAHVQLQVARFVLGPEGTLHGTLL